MVAVKSRVRWAWSAYPRSTASVAQSTGSPPSARKAASCSRARRITHVGLTPT
jgi:hypothetical protein